MTRILFATSEAAPLIKTGGLADVSSSLPAALKALGHQVRIILPAYPAALAGAGRLTRLGELKIMGQTVTLLEGKMPDSRVKVWLVDAPAAFQREGGPYVNEEGNDWPDNAERFTLFCRVIVEVAMNRAGLDWQAEVVHGNDWQTGLAIALLDREAARPATVFSIHNLAYQGWFPEASFRSLQLPAELWSMHSMESYGQWVMIKGGLAHADRLVTVSPTYAHEITTPELGNGMDGLLRYRQDRLTGILNGIDMHTWDPSHDRLIAASYDIDEMHGKTVNKAALQRHFSLPEIDVPLLGLVSRLVEQKGIDLVLEALPRLMGVPVQLVILGSGNKHYEQACIELSHRFPHQVGVTIGYDEALAHLIEAGSDLFLMPSRFEPCGLNQLYSLRYGTPPIVHKTGGLADTVVHTWGETLANGTANGFVFEHASPNGLEWAIGEALGCMRREDCWQRVRHNGMSKDVSWQHSAQAYLALYIQAIADQQTA